MSLTDEPFLFCVLKSGCGYDWADLMGIPSVSNYYSTVGEGIALYVVI